MSEIEDLREIADELQTVREQHPLSPKWDGKLAEAEIDIRGVAAALESREP